MADLTRTVEFFDPHPGRGGARAPMPQEVVDAARAIAGTTGTVRQATDYLSEVAYPLTITDYPYRGDPESIELLKGLGIEDEPGVGFIELSDQPGALSIGNHWCVIKYRPVREGK